VTHEKKQQRKWKTIKKQTGIGKAKRTNNNTVKVLCQDGGRKKRGSQGGNLIIHSRRKQGNVI